MSSSWCATLRPGPCYRPEQRTDEHLAVPGDEEPGGGAHQRADADAADAVPHDVAREVHRRRARACGPRQAGMRASDRNGSPQCGDVSNKYKRRIEKS